MTLALLLIGLSVASALNNGLARTPPMGFNTWDSFRCNFNEADVLRTIDAIAKLGLSSYGYNYFNLDDCWATSRSATGVIQADPVKFPRGIAFLASHAHSKGLRFGIYTDRGTKTCAGRPGTFGFEKIDAATYASWGIDYLKEDSCFATQNHTEAFAEYALMREALNATGAPILFSLCGWYDWYAAEGQSLGNIWRMSGDVSSFEDVLRAADDNAPLSAFAGPGGFNDPDILIGSSPNSTLSITPAQSRTQFNLWCAMAAPLLIGANVLNISAYDIQTYTNKELLAVNQDVLGVQGKRIVGGNLHFAGMIVPGTNIWAKSLSDGSIAVVFVNTHAAPTFITCDAACLSKAGIRNTSSPFKVRDLWSHQGLGTFANFFSATVDGNGASRAFQFQA